MEFTSVASFESLSNLKRDWDQLLQRSASHVPFLTFEYLQAWWGTRGGGEWPDDSQLVLVTAYDQDRLVGIAPLFHAENLQGKPALMLIGAIEVSDFLDFIVQPKDLPEFISGLIDFLLMEDLPAWEVLDFYNILEDSPTIKALAAEAAQRGWDYQQIKLQPSPYIPLSQDFETYLAGIDKKQRHEIRRKLRNVASNPVKSELYFTEDLASLEPDMEAFINMMAQDPNKKEFLTPLMRVHLKNTARIAFDNNWLQLSFFTVDGIKAAANMSFQFNNRLWLYNSGWDWEYRQYSPGWILLAYLIQWAAENQIEEFDFMRGDEDYKYKFGGIDRHIYRVIMEIRD
jgi:CelD/BcsL family acetyltransferase involved in cellulose biosynthesis